MLNMKNKIETQSAPKAVAAYSQAIEVNGFIYVSGQVAIDPSTGILVKDMTIENQTKQVLENIKNILEAAGCSMENVIKTEMFITDMNNYSSVNSIYSIYFTDGIPPARYCVGVNSLPLGVGVEIAVIAKK